MCVFTASKDYSTIVTFGKKKLQKDKQETSKTKAT